MFMLHSHAFATFQQAEGAAGGLLMGLSAEVGAGVDVARGTSSPAGTVFPCSALFDLFC